MKKTILTFIVILSAMMVIYLPTQAKDSKETFGSIVASTSLNLASDVRYVRVRGKRYKVWYKTYYKNGRKYFRIVRYQRA